jgi:hypothetical protein
MQLPGTKWDRFNTLVFTGRRGLETIFVVRIVALAQRHAEHLRPRTSHVGAQEVLGMKGPE